MGQMKIVVCIKQVPDTAEVKIDPKTNTLIRDGVPSIINPDDKAGLEAALRIKDEIGAEVTVVSMGPPQAEDGIRDTEVTGVQTCALLIWRRPCFRETPTRLPTAAASKSCSHKPGAASFIEGAPGTPACRPDFGQRFLCDSQRYRTPRLLQRSGLSPVTKQQPRLHP